MTVEFTNHTEILEYEGYRLEPFISRLEKEEIIGRLAREIAANYYSQAPVFILIEKGGLPFGFKLMEMAIDESEKLAALYGDEAKLKFSQLDTLDVESYKNSTESSGNPRIVKDIEIDIEGKDVILVDDIIDTGLTTQRILDLLAAKQPRSVKLCVLLDKYSKRRVDVKVHYVGTSIEDKFVVGGGLDVNEQFRNLPDIMIATPLSPQTT